MSSVTFEHSSNHYFSLNSLGWYIINSRKSRCFLIFPALISSSLAVPHILKVSFCHNFLSLLFFKISVNNFQLGSSRRMRLLEALLYLHAPSHPRFSYNYQHALLPLYPNPNQQFFPLEALVPSYTDSSLAEIQDQLDQINLQIAICIQFQWRLNRRIKPRFLVLFPSFLFRPAYPLNPNPNQQLPPPEARVPHYTYSSLAEIQDQLDQFKYRLAILIQHQWQQVFPLLHHHVHSHAPVPEYIYPEPSHYNQPAHPPPNPNSNPNQEVPPLEAHIPLHTYLSIAEIHYQLNQIKQRLTVFRRVQRKIFALTRHYRHIDPSTEPFLVNLLGIFTVFLTLYFRSKS